MIDARELDRLGELALTWSLAFVPRLVIAILILTVGVFVAGWASRAVGGVLRRAGHVDLTVQPVVSSVVRYALIVLVTIWALGQIGVQTTSLIAVLGAAGLAVGLALQGTLTNIAAGIMLLWLRPFRLGDYIEVATSPIAGRVREIGLFACRLETFDGVFVFAPNQTLWNAALRNHTRNEGRLVAFTLVFPPATDPRAAEAALMRAIEAAPGLAKLPQPGVFVDGLTGDGLLMVVRVWAAHADIGSVQRDLPSRLHAAFATTGEDGTPAPTRIVRTVPPDADPSRLTA